MDQIRLRRTLRVDGIGCIGLGAAATIGAAPLATAIGLPAAWPILALGVIVLVYGIDNLLVARRPTRTTVTGLLAVDLGFGAAVLGVALADPWSATTGARVALVVLALVSITMGALKLIGRPGSSRSTPMDRRDHVVAG